MQILRISIQQSFDIHFSNKSLTVQNKGTGERVNPFPVDLFSTFLVIFTIIFFWLVSNSYWVLCTCSIYSISTTLWWWFGFHSNNDNVDYCVLHEKQCFGVWSYHTTIKKHTTVSIFLSLQVRRKFSGPTILPMGIYNTHSSLKSVLVFHSIMLLLDAVHVYN